MHHLDLILTLTGGLTAALVLGYITNRLGLSPIVGYLLAGICVGPATPGFVANAELAEQMAEVGVILLMFGVGLHFHLADLLAVRKVALPGALGQILISALLGTGLGLIVGWGLVPSIIFGLALSVASTVVLARVLADFRELHTNTGRIAMGWLVVEDLFTVVTLVLLPTVLAAKADLAGVTIAAFLTFGKIGLFVVVVMYGGGVVIPWVFERMAKSGSRELFTLTVLVTALGIAVVSAQLFGVSMALGAFLAGMVVGRSEFSARAASDALPMKDAFAVLFFVSVGMLFDPSQLVEAPGVILGTLAIVLIGKPLAAFVIVMLLRYPPRTALSVAIALAQIGEFSFILGSLARELGVFPEEANQGLIVAAILSITINPLLYGAIPKLERWMHQVPWLSTRLLARLDAAPAVSEDHEKFGTNTPAIIVGYGPIGRMVARILIENGIRPVIIEMNLDTFRRLRNEGMCVVYGDARQVEVLKQAHVESARYLIFSSAESHGVEEIIQQAKTLHPQIITFVRTRFLHNLPELEHFGAARIFVDEAAIGLAMATSILKDLGATGDQLDRERDRVEREFFNIKQSTTTSQVSAETPVVPPHDSPAT
ncbi:sodium/hydrogen exchanger [Planctopirus limnophila DSM 3776]|uniref:Sodium/hydrogen exchanger n=1 Tax=Planctopirus limnophila (strain ATCC 43296 / DSM 3776 / IFAM 1008 / Mu 290) TaxID=521674 RepID=D5SRR6_PLAL2|nr:cation:proton antiporter [Planctopirus limnophila]ADG66600.1 sodium/hydrogen exchanger [Planctopirus limnophila DSM 3776]